MALSEESSRRRRASYNQLETLWEFLNSHREIATGFNKTAQARAHSRRMWESIAEALNSQGEGAVKDWKGWSSYWVDYKSKLKRRAAVVRGSVNRTGGGPLDVAPLIDIEKKFLGILGDGFGVGLPNIQVDPFPTLPQSSFETASVEEPSLIQVEEVPHELSQEEPHEALQPPPNASNTNSVEPSDGPQPERRRRRRRRENQMSQGAARRSLVELSRERLRLEAQNARTWEHMLSTLQRIANTLDRIASGPHPRNEGAPDS